MINPYLFAILIILIGEYLLSLLVEGLNISAIDPNLSSEFCDVYDSVRYRRSQDYLKDTTYFKLFSSPSSVRVKNTSTVVPCSGSPSMVNPPP